MTSILYTGEMKASSVAGRRMSPVVITAMAFFFFTNAFSDTWAREHRSAGWWLTGSLIAAASLVFWFWRAERDMMDSRDELQQRIRTEALAWSFPCAIAVSLLLGKLQAAGITLPLPLSRQTWVLPMLPYFPILFWVKRRYQ